MSNWLGIAELELRAGWLRLRLRLSASELEAGEGGATLLPTSRLLVDPPVLIYHSSNLLKPGPSQDTLQLPIASKLERVELRNRNATRGARNFVRCRFILYIRYAAPRPRCFPVPSTNTRSTVVWWPSIVALLHEALSSPALALAKEVSATHLSRLVFQLDSKVKPPTYALHNRPSPMSPPRLSISSAS